MAKLGCSSRIVTILAIFLLALFVTGFVIGPLGAGFFGINVPDTLKLKTPTVELPSEAIFHVGDFKVTNTLISSWLTIIVLVLLFYSATRKMKLIPGRLQSIAEMIVEAILNFITGAAGEKNARMFFPLIATIFIYVMTNAYLALLPFYGTVGIYEGEGLFVPIFRAPNTDINLTLSIALISFIFIEALGFRKLGFFHYLNTFFNVGQLRDGFVNLFKGKIGPALSGIAFGFINLFVGFLEVLSHFIRIVSFTFRLFGNMTAGEILLLLFTFLIPFVASIPFYGLELLVGFLQALIFAGLTLVFGIIAITPHEGEAQHST